MLSKESVEIRKSIIKDSLHEDVPLQAQRKEWEDSALSLPLPEAQNATEEIRDFLK